MTRKQIKDRDARYDRMRNKQKNARGRFFYDMKDMAEAKLGEAIANGVAKREGRKLVGVRQHVWGCGCGCVSTHDAENSGASLSPKKKGTPTKHPKRKSHPMFRGEIVD